MTKNKKEIIEYLKREIEKNLELEKEQQELMGEKYDKPLPYLSKKITMREVLEKPRKTMEAMLEEMEDYGKSEGRKEGIAKARIARTNKTKEKVQNAINLLRIEGKEITAYHVAKVADISFNTAKKYLATIAPAG